MSDALSDLLTAIRDNHLRVKRDAQRNPPQQTIVSRVSEPDGSTSITIYAPTWDLCNQKISHEINGCERDGGMASFKGPRLLPNGGYGAVGEYFP